MKEIFNLLLNFIQDTLLFANFIILNLSQGFVRTKIQPNKSSSKTAAVLANGPSLKDVLPRLEDDKEFENLDFIVLNYFAFEKTFFRIKPKHYCFADPMFFQNSHRLKDVRRLFEILDNEIDWDMNIYIPTARYKSFKSFASLTNTHLHLISVNTVRYTGFESFRHYFYKYGYSTPPIRTVANFAIYIAIMKRYSQVRLYGVDHTFLDSLTVNSENELCNIETHFYDNANLTLKPIVRNDNGEQYKIGDYLGSISGMFSSHELLNSFAISLNIKIINCTEKSLIDSYTRENRTS